MHPVAAQTEMNCDDACEREIYLEKIRVGVLLYPSSIRRRRLRSSTVILKINVHIEDIQPAS